MTIGIVLAVCCGRPAVVHVQAPPAAPAPKGFSEIRYEFGSNSLDKTPPFDVPFFLVGDAGDRARRVDAEFVCWEHQKPEIKKKSGPFSWQPRAVSDGTTDFKILITTPLEAERDCQLKLTLIARPPADVVATFKRNAVSGLSDDLWNTLPGPEQHLSTTDSQKIRTHLATILETVAKPNVLRTTGSIFDPGMPAPTFDSAAVPVFNAQDNISAFRASVIGLQLALRDQLQRAVQIDVLKKWLAQLRQRSESDADIRAFVTAHETGLSLVGMTDVRELAAGRLPTAPTIASPDVATDAAGLQAHEANYVALVARIQTLLSALESARIAPPLTAGLSDQERATLLGLVAGPPPPFGEWRQLFVNARNLAERVTVARTRFAERATAIDQLLRLVEVDAVLNVQALITTENFDFGTVRTNYISLDAGLAYGFLMNEVLPYVGANFYFRPVNKDAPLSRAGSFGRRFALTAGVTLKSVAKDHVREDAFFSGALVLGAGLRVSPSIRVAGGVLFFTQLDENPVKPTARRPGIVGFAGLSLDFDIAKALLSDSGLK